MPGRSKNSKVIAAIDVGTNAARLEVARIKSDRSLQPLHQERAPIRPGEGVFATGFMPEEVVERLLSTMRRFASICARFEADVRAVATSALREARNKEEVVERVREQTGIELEVIGGQEEARLICLGVFEGTPPGQRSLLVDIGGGSTEIAYALGEKPQNLFSVNVGAVRLTEIFSARGKVGRSKLEVMRRFAEEALRDVLPELPEHSPDAALGSSGTIGAVVSWAAGSATATLSEVTRALDNVAAMSLAEKKKAFDARRAEIIVAGSVVLEQSMKHLGLKTITAVEEGLRDGVLVDQLRRRSGRRREFSLSDAALAFGRRFRFDEPHALRVSRLSLQLFDELGALHGLPATARPLLETAALLHDVGHVINPQKHHRHTEYLLRHSDLAGLTDHERTLVALIARFHRRSLPERKHASLVSLPDDEFRLVRASAILLRIANALDRSHRQPVQELSATQSSDLVHLHVQASAPIDLELWGLEREMSLFQQVFKRRLAVSVHPTTEATRR